MNRPLEDGPKARILVVDDDPVAARLATKVARFGGFEVQECLDSRKALDLARSWKPDLVVSDVKMPGIDGPELCVLLKGDEATRQARILLVSAEENFEHGWEGRFCGSAGFLAKPFTSLQLLREINRLLGRVAV